MRESVFKWLRKNAGIIATIVLVVLPFFIVFRVAFVNTEKEYHESK